MASILKSKIVSALFAGAALVMPLAAVTPAAAYYGLSEKEKAEMTPEKFEQVIKKVIDGNDADRVIEIVRAKPEFAPQALEGMKRVFNATEPSQWPIGHVSTIAQINPQYTDLAVVVVKEPFEKAKAMMQSEGAGMRRRGLNIVSDIGGYFPAYAPEAVEIQFPLLAPNGDMSENGTASVAIKGIYKVAVWQKNEEVAKRYFAALKLLLTEKKAGNITDMTIAHFAAVVGTYGSLATEGLETLRPFAKNYTRIQDALRSVAQHPSMVAPVMALSMEIASDPEASGREDALLQLHYISDKKSLEQQTMVMNFLKTMQEDEVLARKVADVAYWIVDYQPKLLPDAVEIMKTQMNSKALVDMRVESAFELIDLAVSNPSIAPDVIGIFKPLVKTDLKFLAENGGYEGTIVYKMLDIVKHDKKQAGEVYEFLFAVADEAFSKKNTRVMSLVASAISRLEETAPLKQYGKPSGLQP